MSDNSQSSMHCFHFFGRIQHGSDTSYLLAFALTKLYSKQALFFHSQRETFQYLTFESNLASSILILPMFKIQPRIQLSHQDAFFSIKLPWNTL